MSKVDQYHSALHEADNRYHVYPDCPQGNNIQSRCWCIQARPDQLCQWCAARRG